MANKRTIEFEFLVRDRDAVQGINNIENQVGKMGRAFSTMGGLAKAAISGIALREIGQFVWDATQAAVDVEESTNAIGKVFKDAAGEVTAFGDSAATAVGLSKAEFQGLAAVTGSLLKGVGFDVGEAADQTLLLTERAADMASVFNTDVSDALGAVNSALKGEFNPIEQFGVKLSAAAVASEALTLGLAETKSELTDQDKALAAINLIFAQTNDIAGDFKDTQDGLANSTRTATAEWTNFKAELGSSTTGPAAQAVTFLRRVLTGVEEISGSIDGATQAYRRMIIEGIDPTTNASASLVTILNNQLNTSLKDATNLWGALGYTSGEVEQATREATDSVVEYARMLGMSADDVLNLSGQIDQLGETLGWSEQGTWAVREALRAAGEEMRKSDIIDMYRVRTEGMTSAVNQAGESLKNWLTPLADTRDRLVAANTAQAALVGQFQRFKNEVDPAIDALQELGWKAGWSADEILRVKAALEAVGDSVARIVGGGKVIE